MVKYIKRLLGDNDRLKEIAERIERAKTIKLDGRM
jgi:hypothetical protein